MKTSVGDSKLVIVFASKDGAWGYVDNVLLTYWHSSITVALAARYMQDVQRLNRQAPPNSVGVGLAYVTAAAALPSSETRAVLSRRVRNPNVIEAGAAIVVEGEGFRASAVRAVVTGVSLVSGRGASFRAFANIREAIAFLEQRAKKAGASIASADTLVAAMDEIRAAVARAA